MNRILTCLVFLIVTSVGQSAIRIEGPVFRARKGPLELVVTSMITTRRTPTEWSRESPRALHPGDCIAYSVFLKNVSDRVVRLVAAPKDGIRLGRDFSFSCEPVYVDGGFVRTPASELAIVELKPGELAPLGVVDYTCGGREVGENTFWYSISEVIGREYNVWSGSILCRAPFLFSDGEKEGGEPGATDNPDDAQRLREDH